jgi:hypothetical protein
MAEGIELIDVLFGLFGIGVPNLFTSAVDDIACVVGVTMREVENSPVKIVAGGADEVAGVAELDESIVVVALEAVASGAIVVGAVAVNPSVVDIVTADSGSYKTSARVWRYCLQTVATAQNT